MIRLPKWLLGVLALGLLLGLPAAVLADDKPSDQAKGDLQIQGQIKKIQVDQQQFTLREPTGRELTFRASPNAKFHLNGKDSRFADLKEGDRVTVRYQLEAAEVCSDRATGAVAVVRGQVKRADQNQLMLKDQTGKDMTFQIGQNARVRLNAKAGKVSDLKEGDDVTVIYHRQGDQLMAQGVCSGRGGLAEEVTHGQIRSITPDQHQLVLKDRNGKEWTFHLAREAQVRLNDKESTLNDLKEGNDVTIIYCMAARNITDQ
jgi:Cu/Ag efflux protein CusF